LEEQVFVKLYRPTVACPQLAQMLALKKKLNLNVELFEA